MKVLCSMSQLNEFPSIILFTEANDFDAKTYGELEEQSLSLPAIPSQEEKKLVYLVDYTPDADTKIIASLLHISSFLPYQECLQKAKRLSSSQINEIFKKAFEDMEFYDAVLREFEYVDLVFDLVISASCFAQLKRHRMTTITAQKYNPELGVSIPASIDEIGARDDFEEIIQRTDDTYSVLKKSMDVGAEYVLTNAHRRRILIKVNSREFYHISRLREDSTAQWDIRNVASQMVRLVKEVMPLTCLLIGGKDAYPEICTSVFGWPPKVKPPKLF